MSIKHDAHVYNKIAENNRKKITDKNILALLGSLLKLTAEI